MVMINAMLMTIITIDNTVEKTADICLSISIFIPDNIVNQCCTDNSLRCVNCGFTMYHLSYEMLGSVWMLAMNPVE